MRQVVTYLKENETALIQRIVQQWYGENKAKLEAIRIEHLKKLRAFEKNLTFEKAVQLGIQKELERFLSYEEMQQLHKTEQKGLQKNYYTKQLVKHPLIRQYQKELEPKIKKQAKKSRAKLVAMANKKYREAQQTMQAVRQIEDAFDDFLEAFIPVFEQHVKKEIKQEFEKGKDISHEMMPYSTTRYETVSAFLQNEQAEKEIMQRIHYKFPALFSNFVEQTYPNEYELLEKNQLIYRLNYYANAQEDFVEIEAHSMFYNLKDQHTTTF